VSDAAGGISVIARTARQFPLIAGLVFVLALAPIAFAAKGTGKPTGGSGGGGGSTISGPVMVNDLNGNGQPNFGDTLTFNVSSTVTTTPYVNLLCYQNGVLVYNSWRGFFAGSLDTTWNFVLGSGAWTSGAGSCTAWLGMYTRRGFQRLTSTSFSVGA
jgi:hypothetical protein